MSVFRFQQFSVLQARSGMKVCTDATLFGAMAPVAGGEKVLDIGTGTGLLALMAAQLGAGNTTAVELNRATFEEARINFGNSPWAEDIHAVHADIRDYAAHTNERFDLIISNPPFFERHSKSPDDLRNLARHTDELPYAELLHCAEQLLAANGKLYLLLPVMAVQQVQKEAEELELFLYRKINLKGYERNTAKVAALLFSRIATGFQETTLTIYRSDRVYSKDAEGFLSPFLLRFAPRTRTA